VTVLPLFVMSSGLSQTDITASVDKAWSSFPVDGAVVLTVVYEEEPPDSGTRTRVWPIGEPYGRSLLGRCERALLDAGVIHSRAQIVRESVDKTWGSVDSLRLSVAYK